MTSTNSLNWKKLDFIECGENYSICLETNEVRADKKDIILKQQLHNGYLNVQLSLNGKRKRYNIHQLVWIIHKGDYDRKRFVIDHSNRIKTDNRIENLRLVSTSINNTNIMLKNNKSFEYLNELIDPIVINEECEVYYCKQTEKFYRKVVNVYREIHERKKSYCNTTFIEWKKNNKHYIFVTTHFRETIQ